MFSLSTLPAPWPRWVSESRSGVPTEPCSARAQEGRDRAQRPGVSPAPGYAGLFLFSGTSSLFGRSHLSQAVIVTVLVLDSGKV